MSEVSTTDSHAPSHGAEHGDHPRLPLWSLFLALTALTALATFAALATLATALTPLGAHELELLHLGGRQDLSQPGAGLVAQRRVGFSVHLAALAQGVTSLCGGLEDPSHLRRAGIGQAEGLLNPLGMSRHAAGVTLSA